MRALVPAVVGHYLLLLLSDNPRAHARSKPNVSLLLIYTNSYSKGPQNG